MSGSEKSDKNSAESTRGVADVPEKKMSVLKTVQGCVTHSDIILNFDAAHEVYAASTSERQTAAAI